MLFLVATIVVSVILTFTNCGEEGIDLGEGLEHHNFVFVSYTDSSGKKLVRKTEFFEADGDIYIDGDVLIGSVEDISIGDVVELNNAIDPKASRGASEASFAIKSNRSRLWPNSQVPYVIDSKTTSRNKLVLRNLINEFNSLLEANQVNLQLVPRTDERDYIHFAEKDLSFPMGGQSYIGRRGGAQALKLRTDNFNRTIVHHEIMHALGFKHEHQRSDRQVKLMYKNIEPSLRYNFAMYSAGASIGKYDVDSLLHYHSYAFSKNGEPTLLTHKGEIIERSLVLSRGDIYALQTVYGTTQALPDGIYSYNGRTYQLQDGRYCQLRGLISDRKVANMSLLHFNTMLRLGAMEGLRRSPNCD